MQVSPLGYLGALFDYLFPKRRLVLTTMVRACLKVRPLHVIDVGGALGPDAHLNRLPADSVRFIAFEPDAPSTDQAGRGSKTSDVVMPVGLAQAPGERALHLTKGPFASSLYPANEVLLRDFAVWPWYGPAGEIKVVVDTLDGCLARRPDFHADFVKVDVEGADLEVLQGAEGALTQAFGVQIEVSFVVRNEGAPLQAEIDAWLRRARFSPHQMEREHWLRTNLIYGASSRPQLIWADAIYFRDRDWVLQRLAADPESAPEQMALVLAVLLVYDAHDYAMEFIHAAGNRGLIQPDGFEASVRRSLMPVAPCALRGLFAVVLALLASAPPALLGKRGRAAGGRLVAALRRHRYSRHWLVRPVVAAWPGAACRMCDQRAIRVPKT